MKKSTNHTLTRLLLPTRCTRTAESPYTNAYQRISTNAYTCHNAGLQYGQRKCDVIAQFVGLQKSTKYSQML